MLHKEIAATTELATDQGEFTALAACYSIDRVGDRIIKGAFTQTIAKWIAADKDVPVLWNHSGSADDVIGSIDPGSMRETKDGLYVEGSLDLNDSEVARQAWRSMKRNRVALSFGYLVTDQVKRADGVNELREIDLFEISIVPSPANPDTRVLSMKAEPQVDEAPLDEGEMILQLVSRPREEVEREFERKQALERKQAPTTPVELATFPTR